MDIGARILKHLGEAIAPSSEETVLPILPASAPAEISIQEGSTEPASDSISAAAKSAKPTSTEEISDDELQYLRHVLETIRRCAEIDSLLLSNIEECRRAIEQIEMRREHTVSKRVRAHTSLTEFLNYIYEKYKVHDGLVIDERTGKFVRDDGKA